MNKEREVIDTELFRSADALARRFVQRWDLQARQVKDGRYICIQKPLTREHLFAHLKGEITLGTYILSKKNLARFIVLDADDEDGFKRLVNLGLKISKDQIPSYLEGSRRGGHLWIFFSDAIKGKGARLFGKSLLSKFKVKDVELFPKQDKLGRGPGSLIRMPFGVHKLSGERYGFFHPDGSPIAATPGEQIQILSTPETVSGEAFENLKAYQSPKRPTTPYKRPGESTDPLSERIKASISVFDFVSQYVDLRQTGNSAIGHCPFHEDERPSFAINIEENYWHCFAGCGGGSVINFWSKMREKQGLDPGYLNTISEMANTLLLY